MNPPVFSLSTGHLPVLISMPHCGAHLPDSYAKRMTPAAQVLADTDWHLPQLYQFARAMGASIISSQYSRYVIDLNRSSDGQSLYPGQNTTGLCPTETFLGAPVYLDGEAPDEQDIAHRVTHYWQPYHQALAAELARLRASHGHVLLWEAHSIAHVLPRLFEGPLPDLNLGSFSGKACDPALRDAVAAVAEQSTYSVSVDGRFKGGYITRHYGQPDAQVHALQLELAQYVYMDETAPFSYQAERANQLIPTLEKMLTTAIAALPR
jgi:N-formylglutamate deformylase